MIGVAREIPGYPALRVLDLSCGQGEILGALVDEGCEGKGTRYTDDDPFVTNRESLVDATRVDDGVELASRLPYEDNS